MSKARDGKPDIVVFIVHRPSKCSDCGLEIHPGDFLHVHDEIALCLACADLDHLEFLERGDTAVTRRSRKYSAMSAVVVEWSKYGKRYERQGILVEPEALDRAVAESDADADVRAARAARSHHRRLRARSARRSPRGAGVGARPDRVRARCVERGELTGLQDFQD